MKGRGRPKQGEEAGATLADVWKVMLGTQPHAKHKHAGKAKDGIAANDGWFSVQAVIESLVQINAEFQNSCGCPLSPRTRRSVANEEKQHL